MALPAIDEPWRSRRSNPMRLIIGTTMLLWLLAGLADAQAAGFHELTISNDVMKEQGNSPVRVEGGCLQKDCVVLFKEWKEAGQARLY